MYNTDVKAHNFDFKKDYIVRDNLDSDENCYVHIFSIYFFEFHRNIIASLIICHEI